MDTIKELRDSFRKQGKFYTPPELALFLRSQIDGNPADVYDPTCGSGSLLAAFPDAEKYGQDIDTEAVDKAALLEKSHVFAGDVLTNPYFIERKFDAIVANPPFSVKWTPQNDERFSIAPVLPTGSRADYAFLIHILYMLSDTGTAAVLSFPGTAYRGGRELTLRMWIIANNWLDKVIAIPANTFVDTSIQTLCYVFKKNRDINTVKFIDKETGEEKDVTLSEIEENGHSFSPNTYIIHEEEREVIDPIALELECREAFLVNMEQQINMSIWAAQNEDISIEPFLDAMAAIIEKYRGEYGKKKM